LCHAADDRLCDDDVVRPFIKWIADFSRLHFKVIKYVYQHQGLTRSQMWDDLKARPPREDSAEADQAGQLRRKRANLLKVDFVRSEAVPRAVIGYAAIGTYTVFRPDARCRCLQDPVAALLLSGN
jgi:hypothetical protein